MSGILKKWNATLSAWEIMGGGVIPKNQPPCFSAHKNGVSQTGIATAAATVVTFSTLAYDTANGFNTSTSRYVVQKAGIYLLVGGFRSTTSGFHNALLSFYKNGGEIVIGPGDVDTVLLRDLGVVYSTPLNVNDYLELRIGNYSGVTITGEGSPNYTFFQGHMIYES